MDRSIKLYHPYPSMEFFQKEQTSDYEEAAFYYYAFDRSFSEAYRYEKEGIWILEGKDKEVEFSKAADTDNIIALTEPVVKPFIVHFKDFEIKGL